MNSSIPKSTADDPYPATFYDFHVEGVKQSADVIVPVLIDLVRPASVIDIGCGTGHWLDAFQARGVVDLLGIDGHWVPTELRAIPDTMFQVCDLNNDLDVDRTFDLAICLEVVEHVSAQSGHQLIRNMCKLAPVIAFSAAVPFQRGDGHINEQWPSYWTKVFAECGYKACPDVRPLFWASEQVSFWYRQNLLLFVSSARQDLIDSLSSRTHAASVIDIVHPELFLREAKDATKEREKTAWFANRYLETESEIQSRDKLVADLRADLKRERSALQGTRQVMDDMAKALSQSEKRLAKIETSRAWRIVQVIRRLRARFSIR